MTTATAPANIQQLRQTGGAVQPQQDVQVDFFSKNGFELACRMGKAFSTSGAVPMPFRQFIERKVKGQIEYVENPQGLGNCLVAIEVAKSVGLSIVSVMQNADIIQGKLRWSSKFQIAAVNASRRFTPLKFKMTSLGRIKGKYKEKSRWDDSKKRYDFIEHEVDIENWECVAWAYELDRTGKPTSEICQSIPVSMQMAVEEGWYSKEGSKWQGAMRFQMLQYRAGTFFASIYAPDVIMGMGKSAEEEYDTIDMVQQADGSFEAPAQNVTLQELRAGEDVGEIPTSGEEPPEEIPEDSSDLPADAPPDEDQQNTGPTYADAHQAVRNGDFDIARDIARSLPDGQRKQIEQAIANAQPPADTPPQQDTRRQRRPSLSID